VQLVSKISNLCGPDPPTSQTDGLTDRRTTCDGKSALCTIVHRAVKSFFRDGSLIQSPHTCMVSKILAGEGRVRSEINSYFNATRALLTKFFGMVMN